MTAPVRTADLEVIMVNSKLNRRVGAVLVAGTLGLSASVAAQPTAASPADWLLSRLAEAVERGFAALWPAGVAKSGNARPDGGNELGPTTGTTVADGEESPGIDPNGKP
jgi:hypothetical protein